MEKNELYYYREFKEKLNGQVFALNEDALTNLIDQETNFLN